MGFLSGLFGGGATSGGGDTVTCTSCNEEVDADEVDEDGECESCAQWDGTTYCCGVMYQEGESTCMSCGEPLT